MGKKRKRKKRGIAIDVKAIYQRGIQPTLNGVIIKSIN